MIKINSKQEGNKYHDEHSFVFINDENF